MKAADALDAFELVKRASPDARLERWFAYLRAGFAAKGAGLWGAWPTDSAVLSAFGGLWPFRDPPEMELLYGVAEHLWGNGYAIEVAQAVVAYCFNALDMPVVRASTDTANAASVRVLEKVGFSLFRGDTVGGLDTVFYELPRRLA